MGWGREAQGLGPPWPRAVKRVGRVPAGWAHPALPNLPTWQCWSPCLVVGSHSEHTRAFWGRLTARRALPDFERPSPGCRAALRGRHRVEQMGLRAQAGKL